MQMANACKELNSIMVTGKYTYNLEKDVALELAHCYRDGMSDETARHLIIGIFCASLKADGQRIIDLYGDKLSFSGSRNSSEADFLGANARRSVRRALFYTFVFYQNIT